MSAGRDLRQARLADQKRRQARRAAQQQKNGQAVQPKSIQFANNPLLQKSKRDAAVKALEAGMRSLAKKHGETRTHAEMADRGMSFNKKKTFSGGLGHGHTNLGSFVGQKNRYSLISIPGHKMAAYSNGRFYRLYDPNAGEVTFDSASSLGKFLKDYLKLGPYCKSGKTTRATAYRYSA